jgi:tRNA-dihydrouridine synthase B
MKEEARPLAVQIWDNDPEKMAEVGRRLAEEFGASVVDINFGCPVRDVAEKAESGSYLLRDPERIGRIVARVAKACEPTPVTAKIRLGCTRDSINALEVARAVEEAGAAAITIHGRVAEDFFRGEADWDQIARIKPELKRIPLIGNGDLKTAEDVVSAFERYGVDGVMIGRAGLARPWVFREAAAALRGEPIPPPPTREEQCELIRRQFGLLVEQHGPERACTAVRAMVCWYVQGIPGARRFRTNVVKVVTPEEFYEVLERDFPR